MFSFNYFHLEISELAKKRWKMMLKLGSNQWKVLYKNSSNVLYLLLLDIHQYGTVELTLINQYLWLYLDIPSNFLVILRLSNGIYLGALYKLKELRAPSSFITREVTVEILKRLKIEWLLMALLIIPCSDYNMRIYNEQLSWLIIIIWYTVWKLLWNPCWILQI